jgi:serine/threonine-protein kinase
MLPGTPSYIAPELVHGREQLSPAADLFAFGVIAHELIADRRPFAEAPVLALVERRAVAAPRPITEAWPECPPALAAALDASHSFDPGARPGGETLAGLLAQAANASVHLPQHIETI